MIHAFSIFMPRNIPFFTKLEITQLRNQKEISLHFLDVDDWWESDKLAIQLPHFEDQNVGLVCTNYNVFYEGTGWGRPIWSRLKPSGLF